MCGKAKGSKQGLPNRLLEGFEMAQQRIHFHFRILHNKI